MKGRRIRTRMTAKALKIMASQLIFSPSVESAWSTSGAVETGSDGISLQTIVESHIDELKIEDQISLGDVDVLSMITYPVVIRITRETLKRPVGIGKTEIVGETIDVSCRVLS